MGEACAIELKTITVRENPGYSTPWWRKYS